ncbi:MAG: hypothetical protein KBT14_04095 [Proteobacteria bacterium]|nr:hypothetical protein [Candidatus Enterousia onthequi]
MKNIIASFFITITCIQYSFADNQCSNYGYDEQQCNNIAGCYYAQEWSNCEQCTYTQYSAPGESTCTECDDFAFEENTHKIYDSTATGQAGQSECPWKCDVNYYKSGDNCEICPTGATSSAGSNSITDCQCSNGKHLIRNNDGTYICGTCSQNSKYNSTTYTCDCATGADNNCQCTNNSVYDQTNNKCVCNNTNFPNSYTDENGVVFCSACHQNATYAGVCKCNKGYYGNGNTCTACPYGTTSALGSTDVSNCQMTTNTQFCDANGENCMKLLSGATNIN